MENMATWIFVFIQIQKTICFAPFAVENLIVVVTNTYIQFKLGTFKGQVSHQRILYI